jgi:hypothetical protein
VQNSTFPQSNQGFLEGERRGGSLNDHYKIVRQFAIAALVQASSAWPVKTVPPNSSMLDFQRGNLPDY